MSPAAHARAALDLDDVQAIIKILAELARFDEALQIAIRGGNDTDVDVNRLRAADTFEAAFLQDAAA